MVVGADTLRRWDIRFSFVLTFSAVASLALIGITIWYWIETKSVKDTLIFFSVGAAAVGQITASFYTARVLAATLRKDERDAKRADEADDRDTKRIALAMKREAIRFGERWNHPTMFHARDALRLVSVHHATSDDELRKFIESKETNVIHVVNFIEEMGTACRLGVVDEDTIKEQFDYVVVSTWKKLFPWISKQRQPNEAIWEDFERLYDKWKMNF